MYILILMNFLFSCCIGVFLYNQMKETEDGIEELYDLYYEHLEEERNYKNKKEKKGRVIKVDRGIF